jgi:hypothetical protein
MFLPSTITPVKCPGKGDPPQIAWQVDVAGAVCYVESEHAEAGKSNLSEVRQVRSVFIVLILALALAIVPSDSTAQSKLLRVEVKNRAQYEELAPLHLDIASSQYGSHIDVFVGPGDENRIALLGFKYDVLIEDVEAYAAETFQPDLGDYHTYDESTRQLREAVAGYPHICRIDSIGRSYYGRAIWALKISDNPEINDPHEADVLFVALHHAREVVTPNVLLYLTDHLLSHYGMDPHITHLVDDRETWIVPVLNPDGHINVEQGDLMWRKNMRPAPFGSCVGVDINRNYGFNWGIDDIGSSPNPCDLDYRGTGPFSEYETRAIRDLILDEAHQFKVGISYHSYGDMILFPWGYTDQPTPDHATYTVLADSMSAYNGYRTGTGPALLYSTNGDFDDWMYGDVVLGPQADPRNPPTGKDRVFAFTFEVGGQFKPPDNLIPQMVRENLQPNLFMIEYGDNPYRVWPPEQPEMDPAEQTAGGVWRLRWRMPSLGTDNPPVAFELEKASGVAMGYDGFESGTELWDGDGFEVSEERSYSGSRSLHTGNRSNMRGMLEPVYALHPVIGDSLRFKCWYSMPIGHNFFVEASDDGGVTWLPLTGVRTLPGDVQRQIRGVISGESNGWADVRFSLGGYVGDELLLRLRCSTINSEPTGGIYIDDIGPIVTFRERSTIDVHLTSGRYDLEPSHEAAIYRARAVDEEGQRGRWSNPVQVAAHQGALRRLTVTPNPISSEATVSFLAYDGNAGSGMVPVRLEVFDAAGRLVRTLFEGEVQGDRIHEETWNGLSGDGGGLASGVYFVVLSVRDAQVADKVMLIGGL